MAEKHTQSDKQAKVDAERAEIAKGGFFHNAAVWLLSRFPLTKHKYQNWTKGRRILVGWLLWIVCLPIIPAVAIALWYFTDPEGFKQSPWAKGLIALFIAWFGAFGFIATSQSVPDIGGIYSPTQHKQEPAKADKKDSKKQDSTSKSATKKADGETKTVNNSPAAVATEEARKKIQDKTESVPTRGRTFENCTAAFEAGVFNIQRGDKSYQEKLDRDGDGIACER